MSSEEGSRCVSVAETSPGGREELDCAWQAAATQAMAASIGTRRHKETGRTVCAAKKNATPAA